MVTEVQTPRLVFKDTLEARTLSGRELRIEAEPTTFADGKEGFSTLIFEGRNCINRDNVDHSETSEEAIQCGIDWVKKYGK